MDDPNPLEMFTIDELFEEIARRCDCSLLATAQTTKVDSDKQEHQTWHRGGWAAGLGLAVYAQDAVMKAKTCEGEDA